MGSKGTLAGARGAITYDWIPAVARCVWSHLPGLPVDGLGDVVAMAGVSAAGHTGSGTGRAARAVDSAHATPPQAR